MKWFSKCIEIIIEHLYCTPVAPVWQPLNHLRMWVLPEAISYKLVLTQKTTKILPYISSVELLVDFKVKSMYFFTTLFRMDYSSPTHER